MSKDARATGLLMLVGAAVLFSMMTALVKLAGVRLPSTLMVLARTLIIGGAALVWLLLKGIGPLGTHRRLLFARGVLGTVGLFAYFYSVTRLPLAEATTIHFLNPMFTAVFAAATIRERIDARLGVGLVVALAGVVCVARPPVLFGGAGIDVPGLLFGLLAAVSAASAYVVVRALGGREHPMVIVFWFAMVSLVPAAWAASSAGVMPHGHEWGLLAGVGVITLGAQILLTAGLARVPAGQATAVGYIQLPLAAGFGLVLFDDRPGWLTVVGAGLVLSGTGLAVLRRSGRSHLARGSDREV